MHWLREHKKLVTRVFLLVLIMFLICFGLFSCTSYIGTQTGGFVDMSGYELIQLNDPDDDDEAVCIHTTLGDIVAVLYPEEAPQYVEQFTTLAQEGYYDDTYIFRVEPDVYFEAGAPHPTGTLDTEDYEHVPIELSADLWPFRGALCAPVVSSSGGLWKRLTENMDYFCGSCFIVCNTIEFDDETVSEMEDMDDEDAAPINDAFLSAGGIPNYSQQMTVFGQAVGDESFAVIDAITAVETAAAANDDEAYSAPVEDILITSIDVGTYGDFQ